MKIAISNIAWQLEEEETIANIMQDLNIKGVEIAPTKIWNQPLFATDDEIKSYRNFWASKNIEIVSLQALLFGRNDLTIFDDHNTRKATLNYLKEIINLGSKLGAKVFVFGSPKNRNIGNLKVEEAQEIAQEFFYNLGEFALEKGVIFCIEPNPTIYNCNFVTNSHQGLELVTKVNSKGFGLHLDSAGMTLSEENIEPALTNAIDKLCHFHISEPYLGQVGDNQVNHPIFAQTLRSLNYPHWVSIEMKTQHPTDNVSAVTKALKSAIAVYHP